MNPTVQDIRVTAKPVLGDGVPAAPQTSNEPLPAKRQRIAALDFTKGALVLIMVLYHWLNYFYKPDFDVFRYLRFLTPSFILITGFLISNIYFPKYGMSGAKLPKRLLERGLKLLAVFLGLNAFRAAWLPQASRNEFLAEHSSLHGWVSIYLVGKDLGGGESKTIAFYILLPIAYLLVLSAVLLVGARFYRLFFHLVFGLSLACVLILDAYGAASANLQLVTIGLLGLILGYVPLEKVNRFVMHPYLLVTAYVGYLIAITQWNVIYPLQVVGVCLSLMLIYLVGQAGGEPGPARGVVILLGRYSLLGYIAQIAVLQALHQGLRHTNLPAGSVPALSFVAAVVLTVLIVALTDRARRISGALDGMYKAVFA
jgi:peptidoglycan/LPS O-acetylase OafA/YrhL